MLACTTILQLHHGSILEAAEVVACPFMYTCIIVFGDEAHVSLAN
jgi:hypothetical protein